MIWLCDNFIKEQELFSALRHEERVLKIILARFFPFIPKPLKFSYELNDPDIVGEADSEEMVIIINPSYLFSHGEIEGIDTLRHEVAHICSFLEIGDVYIKRRGKEVYWPHNKNWKKWCRFLGCRPYAKMGKNKHEKK